MGTTAVARLGASRLGTSRSSSRTTSRLRAVAGSWWDPCYSSSWYCDHDYWSSSCWTLGVGHGCYRSCFSLAWPLYLSSVFSWSGCHHTCWWDTWSDPYWSSSRYWWYPSSTYCPTYLYVPSSTVIIESEPDAPPAEGDGAGEEAPDESGASNGEGEVIVASSGAPSAGSTSGDLANKYLDLGDFYFKAGRFSDAADAYARARTYAPDDAALHFVLADAAFAIGDYHFAAFLIAEGLRLDPGLASAKADKRDFYGDAKLFDEHMAALDSYLEDKPYDASAHLIRGYNLCFSERSAAAIVAFQRVLEIAPDHRAARMFLEALLPAPSAEEPASDDPEDGEKKDG
ncbi:MAG: tetratricopeptide repeat protein [Planctomycetes bacterium]|nr:tetratricopeptide repeat protein [Planctomycetota bacterium]